MILDIFLLFIAICTFFSKVLLTKCNTFEIGRAHV